MVGQDVKKCNERGESFQKKIEKNKNKKIIRNFAK